MADLLTATVLKIAECGHDEYWLRDMIYDDPSILGLGDLEAVMKEKHQAQGGRLDLLLKDPSNDTMYEVELQLGATDESHIIRTIEYWDNEKRRWPRRSHIAVLVAEDITNRFFNVVHLLSQAVPIIGVRANVIQVGEVKALHFTKVVDSYEEPEEEPTQKIFDEKHWLAKYPATLECARWYRDLLTKHYGEIPTKYFESYVALTVGGKQRVWVSKRKNDRTLITVAYEKEDLDKAVDHLNSESIQFLQKGDWGLAFNVDLQQLKERAEVHEWVAQRLAPGFAMRANESPASMPVPKS